jgi:DNA-binding beta-propeller fold protein YncE
MAHDVFVSHSSKDKPTADAVCAVLESHGIRCWVAPRDILPGQDWGGSIIEAINGARAMVLIFSANANASSQIKREVERAVNKGVAVIPLRIEDVAPTATLEYFISTSHWLDAFTSPLDRHLQYLAEVVRKIVSGPEVSIPPPVRESESREATRPRPPSKAEAEAARAADEKKAAELAELKLAGEKRAADAAEAARLADENRRADEEVKAAEEERKVAEEAERARLADEKKKAAEALEAEKRAAEQRKVALGKVAATDFAKNRSKAWLIVVSIVVLLCLGTAAWFFKLLPLPKTQPAVSKVESVSAKASDTRQPPSGNTGKELLTLTTSWSFDSVAFSPDGERILTGSSDNTAKVWDAQSGKELLGLIGHSGSVHSVAFSPDGTRIVTGGDKTARVWDAQSGKELRTLKHLSFVNSVAFSPDGKRILTGSDDKTAKVWDARTGKELLTLNGHAEPVTAVAFSPAGERVLTGSVDNTAKVWDAQSGKELRTLTNVTEMGVDSVAFSPDGMRIVTGGLTAKVWDAQSGKEILALPGLAFSIAFSPDGKRILTGSDDNTAKVWDAQSGNVLLTFKGRWHSAVHSVAFSPDGKRIVTCGGDATVWSATIRE